MMQIITFFLLSLLYVTFAMICSIPPYDVEAILVPGGGQQAEGIVHEFVQPRLDCAVKLLEHFPKATIVLLSAGTVYKANPLDPAGFSLHESTSGAHYLLARGKAVLRIHLRSKSRQASQRRA